MTTTESYGCDKHGEEAYQGCAMCDLETLRERLHEAELVAASWKREAELNEQAATDETGWVVEGAWSSPAMPEYWVGSSAWSSDHMKALRFARREDAQQAADMMCAGLNVRICEHAWVSRSADSATHRENERE